jgi:hypothetical protein
VEVPAFVAEVPLTLGELLRESGVLLDLTEARTIARVLLELARQAEDAMSAPADAMHRPGRSEFETAYDCANALWWTGYNSGCRDVAFWASSMRDPGEIPSWSRT